MGALDAFLHGMNFLLPAACVALAVTLATSLVGRFFKQNRPFTQSISAQAAINFIVCAGVLVIGLILTGRDGKMLTYTAMVLASATAQWWLSGGWRR
jgi:flagellar biosynthesis protein FliR